MSFLISDSPNYFLTSLTQRGRELMSYGNLNFKKFVVWDNEIDYTINEDLIVNTAITSEDNYNLYPSYNLNLSLNTNFDGSKPYDLKNVFASKFVFTSLTNNIGYFSSTTNTTSINSYVINENLCIATGTTNSPLGRGGFGGASGFTAGNSGLAKDSRIAINQVLTSITDTGLVMFKFSSHGSSASPNGNMPFGCLWYRYSTITDTVITTAYTGTVLDLDRDLPRFQTLTKIHKAYFYPWNSINSYGSATTECPVWSMNIVNLTTQLGTPLTEFDFNLNDAYYLARYTIYGSKQFNGQAKYFGFTEQLSKVGFVHYTNSSTATTYKDEFKQGSCELDLPTIMWHRTPAVPGTALINGVKFTDKNSPIYYDEIAKSPYTLLRDNFVNDNFSVGRCYFKLKLFVITDQELLIAMSYKSNRNWTIPRLDVAFTNEVKPEYSSGTPLCHKNKVYYFTYGIRMYVPNSVGGSTGYRQILPCGYITRLEGPTLSDSSHVKATFANNSFPYLRSTAQMNAFSGTGWTAGRIHLLIQEIDKDQDKGANNLSPYNWKLMDDYARYASSSYANSGFVGNAFPNPIDPSYLNNFYFTPTREDFDEARVYRFTYNADELYRSFFSNVQQDRATSKLNMTLGDETTFFGNVNVVSVENRYKTIIPIEIKNIELNSSLNPTFNENLNSSTFITSIGVMNENEELVAIAKPKNPIEKNLGKYIKVNLEIDF